MADKDYIGVWSDTAGATSSLSQQVNGIEPGSVLALKVAWNNPNVHNEQTGRSVTFEVRLDGVLFATVSTPDGQLAQVDEAVRNATVTAHNVALVNMERLEAWTHNYSYTDLKELSKSTLTLEHFQQLIIKLPGDVPAQGELSLVWTVDGSHDGRADDFMIADVQLVNPDPAPDLLESEPMSMMMFALDDDDGDSLDLLVPDDEHGLLRVGSADESEDDSDAALPSAFQFEESTSLFAEHDGGLGDILDALAEDEDLTGALESALGADEGQDESLSSGDEESTAEGGPASAVDTVVPQRGSEDAAPAGTPSAPDAPADDMSIQRDIAQ